MVTGWVRGWLRCESLTVLVMCIVLYGCAGGRWWVFVACFLVPDISLAGYLAGRRVGAPVYNIAHSYVGPVVLGILSMGRFRWGMLAALVWGAHIGFDRMLGYGLKYETGFGYTHLGKIGKARSEVAGPAD